MTLISSGAVGVAIGLVLGLTVMSAVSVLSSPVSTVAELRVSDLCSLLQQKEQIRCYQRWIKMWLAEH